ncbi:amidase [Nocardiopsis sp. HNM0947]|uniref:Amidase n=1 Tax=Nocardiopsis coralli TaxID=2772213 RepID=A0ABR9P3N5_9ACTN|nr:amidase [Nocardiopsis coralli]MBE2998458.1 amidase [Nocardiopsis coralli]
MTQIHDQTAQGLAALVRSRELSPVEITEHVLRRTERHDPALGAFVSVMSEMAMEQALNAEKRVMSDAPDRLPPLLGVPVPVKDLEPVAGAPVTHGSRLFHDTVAPSDGGVVTRLRAAGAVITGKTNTPEFGSSCYTENEVAPPTRNPWDTALTPGGSSGGAAAAVAARLAPAAHASDGGGSIRIPASSCGLFGLKPTRGRISGAPARADLLGLSTSGPLTRTVADAALLLDTMAFSAPGDPFRAPEHHGGFLRHVEEEPGRLRIGTYAGTGSAGVELHPDVRTAHEETVALLTGLGHEVEEVPVPYDTHFGGHFAEDFGVLWAAMASAAPVPPEHEDVLTPLNRWLRERARATPAPRLVQALGRLQQGVRSFMTATAQFDALLAPTLARPPVPIGHFTQEGPERTFELMTQFSPFTSLYNVTGQPSVNVPLYWSPDGLPIGSMISAPVGGEGTLLALSAQLERARPWAHRVPPGV